MTSAPGPGPRSLHLPHLSLQSGIRSVGMAARTLGTCGGWYCSRSLRATRPGMDGRRRRCLTRPASRTAYRDSRASEEEALQVSATKRRSMPMSGDHLRMNRFDSLGKTRVVSICAGTVSPCASRYRRYLSNQPHAKDAIRYDAMRCDEAGIGF